MQLHIFSQDFFLIPAFCKYRITSSYEGNLRAEKTENFSAQFLLVCFVGATHAPRRNVHFVNDTSSRNHKPNHAPEMNLISKKFQFITLKKIQTLNLFFFRILLHNRFRAQYFSCLLAGNTCIHFSYYIY